MYEPSRAEDHAPRVRDVMAADPIAIAPDATILDAVETIARHNVGAVVVADGPHLVGIIAERDLLLRAGRDCRNWDRIPVREVMTRSPHVAAPDDLWESALDALQRHRIRHMPVVAQGRIVGMLSIRDLMKHRAELLESLVRQRTAEIVRQGQVIEERDRERTHSLQIAAAIQRRILPVRPPRVEGLDMAWQYHPCDQVAGDFFDVALTDPETLLVMIGDAAGHGVPAAFISLIANTCLRSRLDESASPAALVAAMNDCLHGWVETERFLSLFVAAIDTRTQRMTYVRAGHPRPLLVRQNAVTELPGEGMLVGVEAAPLYVEESLQLRPGDKVVLYTDGLSECRNAADEMFADVRLHDFLTEQGRLSCSELGEALVAEARRFSGAPAFADDLTILLLEATERGAPEPVQDAVSCAAYNR